MFSGPGFLGFQQLLRQARLAVRGQHAAEPTIQRAILGRIPQLETDGLAVRFRDQDQRAGGQPLLQPRQTAPLVEFGDGLQRLPVFRDAARPRPCAPDWPRRTSARGRSCALSTSGAM